MNEEKKVSVKLTHGCESDFIGKDGIKRQVAVLRSEDERYVIVVKTWWDGEEKEAMETILRLGAEAFQALQASIIEFCMDRERWRVENKV